MPKLQASGAFAQALDDNARALNGAYWKVYSAGTTTQATTYSNALLTIASAWPVIGDAAGRLPDIYVAPGNYRIRVETAGGVLIAESDNNVVFGLDPGEVATAKFKTVPILKADETMDYASGGGASTIVSFGDIIEADGHRYSVLLSGATDQDQANANGVKLRALAGASGFDVRAFGAIGNNSNDDTAAIQAAFDRVRASGQSGEISLGDGFVYLITAPIRGVAGARLTGASMIIAAPSFAAKTFSNALGADITIKPMLYFAENDTLNNASNPRRYGVTIAEEVKINCNYNADYCVITDNFFDMDIRGEFQRANKWGFRTFFYGWGNRIRPYVTNAIEGGIWLGEGCNGVDLTGVNIWGLDQRTGIGLLIDGNNNGINCAGGYIEKVVDGLLCRNGCGPVDFSGVDFEDVTGTTVEISSPATTGRQAGPLTLSGCFLESQTADEVLMKATNAVIVARGCRGRGKGVNVEPFETANNGTIYDHGNEFESTVKARSAQYVNVKRRSGRAFIDHNYAFATSALNTAREEYNFSYSFAPTLVSSGLDFSHAVTDAGTQRMVGTSTWFVTDMSGGTENDRMGVSLDYVGGGIQKQFVPIDNNETDLGFSDAHWKKIYANSIRLTAIPTSTAGLSSGDVWSDGGALKIVP